MNGAPSYRKRTGVMEMMLERHEGKEICCSCGEHVGPGEIKAQSGIAADAAARAGSEESLRPARWGWSPRAAPPSPRGGVGKCILKHVLVHRNRLS